MGACCWGESREKMGTPPKQNDDDDDDDAAASRARARPPHTLNEGRGKQIADAPSACSTCSAVSLSCSSLRKST